MKQVAPASDRPVCHEVQQPVTSICVASTGSPGPSSGCTQPAMGGSGCICLPISSHFGQSGGEVAGPQNHSDCSRVAQYALVLGSSDHVKPDSLKPAQPAKSSNTAILSDSSQESVQLEPSHLAPRASAIKKQGFSETVAARVEAPQRGSTRSVYEASGPFLQSGASVTRWTSGHPL